MAEERVVHFTKEDKQAMRQFIVTDKNIKESATQLKDARSQLKAMKEAVIRMMQAKGETVLKLKAANGNTTVLQLKPKTKKVKPNKEMITQRIQEMINRNVCDPVEFMNYVYREQVVDDGFTLHKKQTKKKEDHAKKIRVDE